MQKKTALHALLPWLVAGGLLISLTAEAGYAPYDSIEILTATSGHQTRLAEQDNQLNQEMHAAEIKTLNESNSSSRHVLPSNSLLFNPDIINAAASGFDGIAFSYNGFMPHVWLETSLTDGATQSADNGDTVPDAYIEGTTSPSLLSALTARAPDGASPLISRAIMLASSTPAPIEPEIVMMPQMTNPNHTVLLQKPVDPQFANLQTSFSRNPQYTSLINPRNIEKEQKCLAEAVYFEARSESAEGQAAVAQVVLNRVKSGLYPASVCGVVYQNRNRYMACQFSFACEGKSLRITEQESWKQAVQIAREVVNGKTYLSGVGSATHYHAHYVRPTWSRRLKRTDKIGTHIFYKLRPGQA